MKETSQNPPDIMYSINEINYYSYEDMKKIVETDKTITFLYVGERIVFKHSDFFNIKTMIEEIENSAYEESEDFSTNYIDKLSNMGIEKENKLTAKFSLESLNKRFLIELQARLISDYLYISQAGTPPAVR